MRLKLLLVSLLMASGMLYAQDTIKSLVITEAKYDEARFNYVELTNMGDETLNLHDFEIGSIGPWTQHYLPNEGQWFIIGDYLETYQQNTDTLLAPGESFWISVAYDFTREMWLKDPDNYAEKIDRDQQWEADIVLHAYETNGGPGTSDSISPKWETLSLYNGRDALYVRYYLPNGDSAVIDQVGGVWDEDRIEGGVNGDHAYDVAGYTNATDLAVLVRKFNVKQGNLNFAEARGLTAEDSEWIVIPQALSWSGWEVGVEMFWTVNNHGDYQLNETTLTSSTLDIDWDNDVINVPWGVHNRDSVMMQMDYHPGLAWHYDLSHNHEDSAFISARTGDTLTVWACGNVRQERKFHINVLPPTDDANVIIPKATLNWSTGFYENGHGPRFQVTDGVPGMDTIRRMPFATRVDTLLTYFEKAPEAEWEMVWVDGNERPDLLDGDILRVTAKDGSVKDYYCQVREYRPSHDADLLSITWPDIPPFYKNVFGYLGDTIPNFNPGVLSYKAFVPADVDGIPALQYKKSDLNARVEVKRAVNLYGSAADQTAAFKTIAEDDTSVKVYEVQFVKEKLDKNIQPWAGEAFVSEFIWQEQWNNSFYEICNPGTMPMDMSQYMFMCQYTRDPAVMLTWNQENTYANWENRYQRYIPGRKWVDSTAWGVDPLFCEQDLNVNPIVLPGDVFVFGSVRATGQSGYPWWASEQMDVDFYHNPWDEPIGNALFTLWYSANWFMYKIVNDSVRNGTKAATDPADFVIHEAWSGIDQNWIIGGRDGNADNQTVGWARRPQYYKAKPGNTESWGTQVNNGTKVADGTSEWITRDRSEGGRRNHGWPMDILYITEDIGSHFMYEVTEYKSTVTSLSYKVSLGYSEDELIRGLVTGVDVDGFLAGINKADDGQILTVKSGGVALAGDAVITHGDSLVVVSANGDNTSRYFLEVTDEGLSDDAVLVATAPYVVDVTGATGTVSGFDYGTKLKDVVANVTVPAGATMEVVDDEGAYVSMLKLNYDTVYVDVQVSDMVYFVVVAEDGATTITYQLTPNAEATDAFVVSDIYEIDEDNKLIQLVPNGTAVAEFYANLTPATGATMQVKDKLGYDRTLGNLYLDDKLLVTSSDGTVEVTYYLAMLELEVNYLAYVRSNVYTVDQVGLTIDGGDDINRATIVSDFLANLIAAPGATMTVLDADMVERATDTDMDLGDILMVVAGNQTNIAYYDINVADVSVGDLTSEGVSVYPNPSTGMVNVAGLANGNRVQVYNAVGAQVVNTIADSDILTISLDNQESGFYFMVVSNEKGILGHYKLIIE